LCPRHRCIIRDLYRANIQPLEKADYNMRQKSLAAFGFLVLALMATARTGDAATCGNGPAGFATWKEAFAQEARAKGIGSKGVAALMGTTYSSGTIRSRSQPAQLQTVAASLYRQAWRPSHRRAGQGHEGR
jgi:membrane-bound lytic murein transglycosylase B